MPAVKPPDDSNGPRVGVLCEDTSAREAMASRLREEGLRVVFADGLSASTAGTGLVRTVDVLVVDMEGATDAHFDAIDSMLDNDRPEILFGEGAGTASVEAVRRVVAYRDGTASMDWTDSADRRSIRENRAVDTPGIGSLSVWVLGASFGGPEAIKRFLSVFRRDIPQALTLILVQHIGVGFIDMLASQLNRCTSFRVLAAAENTRIEPGHVYVAPVQERIEIDAQGCMHLVEDEQARTYAPSIDGAMREVASRFGADSGAIIFSGMGADGAEGARAISAAGGTVWAQSPETCAIDSMPNQARLTGAVSFSESPEGLAEALLKRFQGREVSKRII